MLDLETLGTGPTSSILSIGAVKFSPSGIGDRFYSCVDLASCERYGLKIDASTVAWWMHNDRSEARKTLNFDTPMDLPTVLEGFSMWLPEQSWVWSNGAAFNNVILRNAYKAVGAECPYTYRQDCCFRTLKVLCRDDIQMPHRAPVSHDALSDAESQAEEAIIILNSMAGRVRTW